jgi:hypothetical protein
MFPSLYNHLRTTVAEERKSSSEKRLREQWWKFSRPAERLYKKIGQFNKVLVMGRLATFHTLAFQRADTVFSDALSVFLLDKFLEFAVLQSRLHEMWAIFLGSSFKDDPRYIPEDCFETFPFPKGSGSSALEEAGRAYYDYRSGLMIARNEGLTKTYNRFHARGENGADIARLRALHHEMDVAVLRAYGWDDLADHAAPQFIEQEADEGKTPKTRLDWPSDFKDEVLARLLALNATRAAEERAAGLVAADEGGDEEIEDGEGE